MGDIAKGRHRVIQHFQVEDLPEAAPAALFTDGVNTAILFNPRYLKDAAAAGEWLRPQRLVNSLLAAWDEAMPKRFRATG